MELITFKSFPVIFSTVKSYHKILNTQIFKYKVDNISCKILSMLEFWWYIPENVYGLSCSTTPTEKVELSFPFFMIVFTKTKIMTI